MENENKKYHLQPVPEGRELYSYHTVFGTPLDLMPEDFTVLPPLEIKNQDINYPSDFCGAYTGAEVAEDQEGVTLVPEYSFAAAKSLLGPSAYKDYGLNLVDICEAGIKIGFLERQFDPFHCATDARPARDIVANFANWPEDLKMLAWDHAKASYFKVDGPHDFFDNIRAVMWKNMAESRSIIAGTTWYSNWNDSTDGIITASMIDPSKLVGGHALKIFGQKTINGTMYLVAQLSDGPDFGDHGLFYFSREVINKVFKPYGAFTFKDLPHDTAAMHNQLQLSLNATRIQKILATLSYMIKQLITSLKK